MLVRNNITYTEIDGINYPDFEEGKQPPKPIGQWGRRHAYYLKEFNYPKYFRLLCTTDMYDYLELVNEEATELYDRLVEQYKKEQGVTEKLKAKDMMEWVGKMNNIHNQVTEVVYSQVIFVDEAVKQERFERYKRYKGALKPDEEPDFKSFTEFEKKEERNRKAREKRKAKKNGCS